MNSSIVHLPDGQNLTVTPVFGGLFFKANDLTAQHSPFPAGFSVVLSTAEENVSQDPLAQHRDEQQQSGHAPAEQRHSMRKGPHRFKGPTLHNDHLYISSISNPSSTEFKPATSPTRQIAMMLWSTLYWYFHQPEPNRRVVDASSQKTPDAGKPMGDWRINIDGEGIFKGKTVLPKLERMGLISCEDSSVGMDGTDNSGEGWTRMFVSRRAFWQMDPRIYLFTLSPMAHSSPYATSSPYPSRPASPSGERGTPTKERENEPSHGLWSTTVIGPFRSSSHLPTYYPPAPPQYTITNHTRHPIRPKPPRQGETFYTRYIPSVGQYLSFRVASLSPRPLRHIGLVSTATAANSPLRNAVASLSDTILPTVSSLTNGMSDIEYLHKWMNDPRVNHFWGEAGPMAHQEEFLKNGLNSKHSIPVMGCWDGKPFGYFEIYWVKEDTLGRYLGNAGDYDRGFHCLVGEQEFRGEHRVKVWISALVHYCWLADNRTDTVMLEPRVDNQKLAQYLMACGFYKEREVSFPHKQANVMKTRREAWEGPAL